MIAFLLTFIILIDMIFPVRFELNYGYDFLDSVWVSSSSPVFYHYFSRDEENFSVEIHDKYGDLASIVDGGILDNNELTFEGTNNCINIYKYENGSIRVFNIDRNGEKEEFTPLERLKYGN
jgi:hypothetical protein